MVLLTIRADRRVWPSVRTGLALALCAALCTSCAVGPNYRRPTLPATDHYIRSPLPATVGSASVGHDEQHLEAGTEITREWWTVFASPALNDLVQRAFAHNPTIESAQAAL